MVDEDDLEYLIKRDKDGRFSSWKFDPAVTKESEEIKGEFPDVVYGPLSEEEIEELIY